MTPPSVLSRVAKTNLRQPAQTFRHFHFK